LLVTGLLLAPAIILQQNLAVKIAQVVLFLGLALAAVTEGRRRLLIGGLVLIGTTILVNLFSPAGKVVFNLGPLRITRGALHLGVAKATTLASLLYVSRFCVRPSVRLPGAAGRYVSETFTYLGKLLSRRTRISRHNLVRTLDEQFESILESADQAGELRSVAGRSLAGILVLAAVLGANWVAVFFPLSILLAGH
jgi:hypothetical protein